MTDGSRGRPAPIPADEPARLAALVQMRVLDTGADPQLDEVTQLASRLLDVPVVLVSLVDGRRQWFKSRVGLDLTETHRDHAVCAYTIHSDEVFAVPDSRLDDRFADALVVANGTAMRFYAGVALHAHNQQRVGTLCVLGEGPRELGDSEQDLLKSLARIAEARLQALAKVTQLEACVEEVTDVQHIVAHDLPAPVRQITGLLEAIDDEGPLADSMLVRLAKASAYRLNHLSRGLREYLRGVGLPVAGRSDLAQVAASTWAEVSHGTGARLALPQDLPTLPAHPDVLREILHNLFDNAIMHSARDDVTVRVTAQIDNSRWRIEVRDDGRGVDPSQIDRLFQLFWKERRDELPEHVGTGLSIVRRLVVRCGCQVGAEPTSGGGLTVWFTWPALPESAAPRPGQPTP